MKNTNQLKQFRAKTIKELYKELIETHEKLQNFNFSAKFRKIKDVSLIRKTKKCVAQILTIINEKLLDQSIKQIHDKNNKENNE